MPSPVPEHPVVAARRAYVSSIEDPDERRHVHFFFDLDHATNPTLVRELSGAPPPPAFLAHLGDVYEGVARRIRQRAFGGDVTDTLDPTPIGRPALVALSELQRTIYERHFSLSGDAVDVRAAFEGFAGGRFYTARFGEWDAAPRSPMILAFAEFSIACIDAGVHGSFWARLLPAHVMAQSVYARATGTEGRAVKLSDFFVPDPQIVDAGYLDDLRTEYAALGTAGLIERHTFHCRAALCGAARTSDST